MKGSEAVYTLSIDFGTSSVKAAVLDSQHQIVASAKAPYHFHVYDSDKVELDPEQVFAGFVECTRKMSDFMKDVELIGFDTFSPSLTLMDEQGRALYPVITHLDRRSRKQTREIVKAMGEDGYQQITGILPFAGGASVTSLMWMMENEPHVVNSCYRLGHFNTYIYKRLTGVWATDPVNASMMGIYETVKDTGWSQDILKTFHLPAEKLPDIHEVGEQIGTLCREVADVTGLRRGIPVALGSNDATSAQIGAGNSRPGDILDISGSSEMISILTDKPIIHKNYYLRRAALKGQWQIFAITVGGFALDWFRREFFGEMEEQNFYEDYLPKLIENRMKPPTVRFHPYLAGDRQSLKKKRGVFSGLTLETTREDMLMAILYGIHDPILKTLKVAENFLDLNPTIKVTGGLTGQAIIRLKRQIFKGSDFVIYDDCPIRGNVLLAKGLIQDRTDARPD